MLKLNREMRADVWQELSRIIEEYAVSVSDRRVAPELDPARIRARISQFDFKAAVAPVEAVRFAVDCLLEWQVHTAHPSYFGLFNPNPATMGIVADALVAAFNPQLAAWSHSPFAVEIESHLIRAFGEKFGYDQGVIDGVFCTGGAEANHTALLTALASSFPEFGEQGAMALGGPPRLYVSAEAHHSLLKAARVSGIGARGVSAVAVDDRLKMDVHSLEREIESDLARGARPFMIVGTAGTTAAGILDPLVSIGEVARRRGLWFHVDAAWGGAAALLPELRAALDGCELADSITFDAHKWLSVPMGAGMFITRREGSLSRAFQTTQTYMPKEASGLDIVDPFAHSLQWSRRFIGLKVFLTLAVAGWDGYRTAIRRQVEMGKLLRQELADRGWAILNETPLPVVCFADPEAQREGYLERIVTEVLRSGRAWISTTRLAGKPAIRACITNFETDRQHVHDLAELVTVLRDDLRGAR